MPVRDVPRAAAPRRRRALFAVLAVVGICGAGGAGIAAASSSAGSSPPPGDPVIVRDASGQLALSVQLVSGGLQAAGNYELTVGGTGSYSGTIGVSESGSSGVYHLTGTAPSVLVGPGDHPAHSSVELRMEGIVKPADDDFANINIWVGSSLPADPVSCATPSAAAGSQSTTSPADPCSGGVTKYHLQTQAGSTALAADVADRVVQAMKADDSSALWSLLSPEVQQGLGDQSALAPLFASGQGWALDSYQLLSPGATSFNEGYEFYAQALQGTVTSPSGDTSTEYSVLLFVYEGGTWRFIGAESPSQ